MLSFALEQPIPSLAGYAWHARGYGDFWAHMLVAEGAVDGAVDAVGVKVWDLAAIQPIVEEAGGRFSDAAGARGSTAARRSPRTATCTTPCSRPSGRRTEPAGQPAPDPSASLTTLRPSRSASARIDLSV